MSKLEEDGAVAIVVSGYSGDPDSRGNVLPSALGGFSSLPVGTRLYPKLARTRLELEVQVANENALHWKNNMQAASQRGDGYRSQLRECQKELKQAQQSYNSVIRYVLASGTECPIQFLECWNEGDFDSCRKEWPDAPAECYVGCDPLNQT